MKSYSEEETDRIIQMAWEDHTPFDAIEAQFGLAEKDVIELMRREMKSASFKMWRARVQNRKTKHRKYGLVLSKFRSKAQKHITQNRISKR